MHRSLSALALVAALTADASLAQTQTPQPQSPTRAGGCPTIGGLPSIGATDDDGATWSTSNRPLALGQGTFGMTVVRGDGTLLAEYQGRVYASTSAGCTWHPIGRVEDSPLLLVGSSTGGYAYNLFSSREVWRIDTGAPPPQRIVRAANLAQDVIGMGVDPMDPMHVRALGRQGGLFDSTNGGASWQSLGSAPTTPLVYFAAFDPNDLDHIVVGMVLDGVITTFDAGATWTSATGLTQTGGSRNSFSGSISELSSSRVWVNSIDLDESSSGAPSGGKHVYVSNDGGLSFAPVVDAGNGVVLTNGLPLAPDPNDVDVVYFAFGSSVFVSELNLYRYDDASGQLTTTTTTTTPQTKVRAFALPPQVPGRVVVGFEGS